MKKIECIIRSEKLKDITGALLKIGIGGMTVSDIRGFGGQNQRTYNFLFVHKVKIEIYVVDSQVNDVVSVVLTYCSTHKAGDGKIAVLPLEDCIRISTGERKNKAIIIEKEARK